MLSKNKKTKAPAIVSSKRGVTIKNSYEVGNTQALSILDNKGTFYYSRNQKYIPLGKLDNLPNLFLEARLTSTTHNACITSIVSATIGKGLSVVDVETPDEDLLTWMKSVNNKRQTFKKFLKSVADTERTQGNQFTEVVRGEVDGKRFIKVYSHNPLHCRLVQPDNNGYIEAVLISEGFANKGYTRPDDIREIPIWSPNALDQKSVWVKGDDGTERTMLHFKNEVSGIDHYGIPASVASIKNQKRESMHEQHDIDNLENNMILGGMLTIEGSMTDEEAHATAQDIIMSHTGEGKTGRIAVVASESGIQANGVKFTPYNTQKEGSFLEADKRVEEKIIAAHGWDSILAGINRSSTLGSGGNYIRSIWDIKEAALLNPYRESIIDDVVIPIMDIYAGWMNKPEIGEYEWKFTSSMPYSFMSDINPVDFMTINEMRTLAGLTPDAVGGNKYLSEIKKVQTL